jgi:hypothetical protein
MKVYWGSEGIASRILYHQGKSPRYPLDRRLGGPQSRSGHGVKEQNFQLPLGIEPRSSDYPARSLVVIPTDLSVANYQYSWVIFWKLYKIQIRDVHVTDHMAPSLSSSSSSFLLLLSGA